MARSFTLLGFLLKWSPRKALSGHSKLATPTLVPRCTALLSSHILITTWHIIYSLESRTLFFSSLYHKGKNYAWHKLNSQCAVQAILNSPYSYPWQSHNYLSKRSSNEALPDKPHPCIPTNFQCTCKYSIYYSVSYDTDLYYLPFLFIRLKALWGYQDWFYYLFTLWH